jgi:hypothetical protein
MAKYNLKQEVILFKGEKAKGMQDAYLEDDEIEGKWISVSHDGEELSMSLKNWDALVKLVEQVKAQSNG